MKLYLLAILCFLALGLHSQTEVQIIGGERLSINQIKKETTIAENVVIKHNGVTIQCDSAIRKSERGIIEGYGNIVIFQPDTFYLSGGDYLKYDEATKTAMVNGKQVILRDDQMTLKTTSILYNTVNQTGFYTNYAEIVNGSTTLSSGRGTYFKRANLFNFKKEVVLRTPDYTMFSDTLDYFSNSKTAYFYGPTKIVNDESTILCQYGWYNTKTEKAQFSKEATIISGSNTIKADSLLYDKKKGEGRGIGNIVLTDTTEKIQVYGQRGLYYEQKKETWITHSPMAQKMDTDDTFFILADTFYYLNDSNHRMMKAFHNTSILQKDLVGHCDSLLYNFKDSQINLYQNPILWNENNQITGDTMYILLRNKKIYQLIVKENAFIASQVKPNYYNQISGVNMVNYFNDNKLSQVLVDGNAQIIYYIRDNDTDTAEYSGVNKEACKKMLIFMDSSKVSHIKFYGQPKGKNISYERISRKRKIPR
jgi:lipopolysaccharide export system protein LptA